MIETPPKIWRPKPISKYIPPEYNSDIDEGIFEAEDFGSRTVFKPKTITATATPREDIISFGDQPEDSKELQKGLKVGSLASENEREQVIDMIKKYWDCFCKRGAQRTILEYEFSIDTGKSKPVCCRSRQYGPHESSIMMTQIKALLDNDWIEEIQGPWGSIIVLAPKPHQEHIEDIEDFIWRMCVSYRSLNSVTKPFTYPIPRCDDAIGSLNLGAGRIYIITVDARQGYHQVAVRSADKEKLAFFAPNGKKYTYKVMPFGPMNAPAFYTYMMQQFRDEWDALFYLILNEMKELNGQAIKVSPTNEVTLGGTAVQTGSKGIIDDILIWSTALPLVLTYFECVCKVFQKYRVSFRLDKCEFLKDRVEYVGHDLTPDGNCPAQSKFNMINDWQLPTTGQSLHSFVGLINFYHNYVPYFEIRIKPLRALHRKFNRKPIPPQEWTTDLKALFEDMKKCLTSSPVLTRYDPSQPVFLKTDWSAAGMGWILLQPAGDTASQAAAKVLRETGECTFDINKSGARLQPISYGSRACTEAERHFHSFVGEVAAGRWGIAQNKKYLWGAHFYWFCDCTAVKEVLEYDGNIHMVMRWTQELLGYHFTIVHRPAKMMADVDALTRRFGKPLATHIAVAYFLSSQDRQQRPLAYMKDTFHSGVKVTKVPQDEEEPVPPCPPLTNAFISKVTMPHTTQQSLKNTISTVITSSPVLFTSSPLAPAALEDQHFNTTPRPCQAAATQYISWTIINDCAGAILTWIRNQSTPAIRWHTNHMFVRPQLRKLFQSIHPQEKTVIKSLKDIIASDANLLNASHIVDITFTPHTDGSIFEWTRLVINHIQQQQTISHQTNLTTLWVGPEHCTEPTILAIRDTIQEELKEIRYTVTLRKHQFQLHDVAIASYRTCIHIYKEENLWIEQGSQTVTHPICQKLGYGEAINEDLNRDSFAAPVIVPAEALERPAVIAQSSLREPKMIVEITPPIGSRYHQFNRSAILDPCHPAMEPTTQSFNDMFGHRFGIPYQNSIGLWTARKISDKELLHLYGVNQPDRAPYSTTEAEESLLDTSLLCSVPPLLFASLMEAETPWAQLFTAFTRMDDETHLAAQCLTISASPAPHTLDWTHAYGEDPDTGRIAELILDQGHSKTWTVEQVSSINKAYHAALKVGHIQPIGGKLVLFKAILADTKYIGLIIVPLNLRKPLFDHYHAGPTGGHMGEYKTLYRLRARFFWPKMREDIKSWAKGCAHCQSYNAWRNRRSELYFSWPVTVPFWIMHVDLWSPGVTTDSAGRKGYLLNAMCDISQFVISTPVFDISAANLAKVYMEQVILNFGISAIVVVDDGSTFKGAFKAMCEQLKVTFWALSRGNHKGLSVERYHRYLNKTQAIVGNDRGTHKTFIQNAKTSQYAWNSAPIDNTDIVRSLVAVGREFRFPLDIELCPVPPLNDKQNGALAQYLRDVSNDSAFATSVLQILIEERRSAHCERHNQGKSQSPAFKVGDAVKAHVQVQSNQSTGQVGKLSYRAKGPFQITEDLGSGSFEVQRYNEPNSARRKYKAIDLYLLPPVLYPAEPLDTMDQRYLNYEHAPIMHPLQQSLNIEFYNNQYLNPDPQHLQGDTTGTFTIPLDQAALETPHVFPTTMELHAESNTDMSAIEVEEDHHTDAPSTKAEQIVSSKDKLFFIQYTPEGTMKARWYLVQVDMESTAEVNPNYSTNGEYYCVFLAKHRDDNPKSDEHSRFWPDWYRYTKDPITGIITYTVRVLFPPHRQPDPARYIQWATTLQLHTTPTVLLGPFDFEATGTTNRTKSKVAKINWQQCYDICVNNNITPPTTGSQSYNQPRSNKTKAPSKKRSRRCMSHS